MDEDDGVTIVYFLLWASVYTFGTCFVHQPGIQKERTLGSPY